MKNIVRLFLVSNIIFFNVQSMFLKPLSLLEKQLIQRKITKRGTHYLRTKIESDHTTLLHNEFNPKKLAITLTLEDVFYKSEAATNPLVQKIFNKIEKIETKSGYIPSPLTKNTQNGYKVTDPTNYVGPYSRYYRLEGQEECVLIKSEFYNKAAIMKLIDTCKE